MYSESAVINVKSRVRNEMREFVLRPRPKEKPLSNKLTPSEQKTLNLMVAGLSNKEIAIERNITEGSVKVYTSRVYAKLRLDRKVSRLSLRIDAVRKAISDIPKDECKNCAFRGFAGWAKEVANQLLET